MATPGDDTPRPFWEAAYSRLDGVETFGPPNPELVELLPELPAGGQVLDVGCGEGRLSLYFARQGFHVEANDVSEAGIAKVQHYAAEEKLPIHATAGDLRTFEPVGPYDLAIADGVLHLVEKEHADALIRRVQAATAPGGWNMIKIFTTKVPPPPDLAPFHIGLREEGELFDLYEGWEFRLRQSYILHDEHPGGIKHTHPIDKVLARKPQ